ncbi:MAG TPA: hypothetical protein VNZ26_20625 [Vicinamibacterales bacterium]|nr:hypothetical protein [Vicinamibacterales bacterium]
MLAAAGNPSLMTSELRVTLADHAAGNYRVLMKRSEHHEGQGQDVNDSSVASLRPPRAPPRFR